MNTTEAALKERIKELTCLYEVSSILMNVTDTKLFEELKAIAKSLKKAFQFPPDTEISIFIPGHQVTTGKTMDFVVMYSTISLFNKKVGSIKAHLNKENLRFLKEEQQLMDNVALKIGDLMERIEIRDSESRLKMQMERADRLNILGELTAGIAHELNTPLANILGYAELLKPKTKGDQESESDVEKIISSAIFSREVVKKLMFFACEMPQEMKRVNIVPSIKSAMDLLDATFRKNQVKYIVKIEEEQLWLRADIIQLTQIIFNLVINAIYFSPKNALVTVEAVQNEDFVILKIEDEGSGLTEAALEKVFQPFFTTKPVGEGVGLGLSVVHGIVASHKGTITAVNNKDHGATFTVTLPKS
ncbi:sensor histidine kinase [Flavimarina sp. Hel_I_48]|uniref:sensor histidine kinase n=1 Tax=Flavimarina sp. Hel_I_48 TaxID=1392488 RepID=UPI0004DECE3D|nr:HAMP domain-containing sensor histidine kinase [Flavimarina sp. Hel_I_48]